MKLKLENELSGGEKCNIFVSSEATFTLQNGELGRPGKIGKSLACTVYEIIQLSSLANFYIFFLIFARILALSGSQSHSRKENSG